MDIFKLIFEHDLTLEHLSGNEDPRNRRKNRDEILASFLKPQKTYNRYYFTGTRIRENKFGLNTLEAFPQIIRTLDRVVANFPVDQSGRNVSDPADTGNRPVTTQDESREVSPAGNWHLTDGTVFNQLHDSLQDLKPFKVLISGQSSSEKVRQELILDDQTGIRERFRPLTHLLDKDHLVLITEKAHHGIDLHLFSRHNLYEPLFYAFREMTGPRFRYFSINGKRVANERQYYFETWTLERPPHGFQEVTGDAEIR